MFVSKGRKKRKNSLALWREDAERSSETSDFQQIRNLALEIYPCEFFIFFQFGILIGIGIGIGIGIMEFES